MVFDRTIYTPHIHNVLSTSGWLQLLTGHLTYMQPMGAFGLFLEVLGPCFTYLWRPGSGNFEFCGPIFLI